MAYIERKCPRCGASYAYDEARCHNCDLELEQVPVSEETLLHGVPKSQWHTFIDRNASRYVELYAKNEDNAFFLHMNWAALFFNVFWLFYRKMYRFAFVLIAIVLAVSAVTYAAVAVAFGPAIREANEIIAPYSEYLTESGGLKTVYEEGSPPIPHLIDAVKEYNEAVRALDGQMTFWFTIPSLLLQVLFGLGADWLYRVHIRKHIAYSEGGVSVGALIGGGVLYLILEGLVIDTLLVTLFAWIVGG